MVAGLVESLRELPADDLELDAAALLGKLWELDPYLRTSPQEVSEALTALAKSEANKQADAHEDMRLLGLTAAQGNADAQCALGHTSLLESQRHSKNSNKGGLADLVEARWLFGLASKQGHTLAQLCLGRMHFHGQGGPQDFAEARRLLGPAAAQGNIAARAILEATRRREQEAKQAATAAVEQEQQVRESASALTAGKARRVATAAALEEQRRCIASETATKLATEQATAKALVLVREEAALAEAAERAESQRALAAQKAAAHLYAHIIREASAATSLQARIRGWLARQHITRRREALAATSLQARIKGWLARQRNLQTATCEALRTTPSCAYRNLTGVLVATSATTAMAPRGNVLWGALPEEIIDHIVRLSRSAAYYLLEVHQLRQGVYNTRCINRTFRSALRPVFLLTCPITNPNFPSIWVEGLLRLAGEMTPNFYRELMTPTTYSSLHSTVHSACVRKPNRMNASMADKPCQRALYNALGTTLTALLKDGTLRWITGQERAAYVNFVRNIFSYLDRFYVKRLSLPSLEQHLTQAFANAQDSF